MADGYGIYHEFDYGDRHLERGEYVQIETGMMRNDQSLINIGYIKPHDGKNLIKCLRCPKSFVAESFIRYHEKQCEMVEVEVEPVTAGVGAETEQPPSAAPLSIGEQVIANQKQGE